MKLYEQIKHQRSVNGMSQETLAEKIGVSRQAVAKWESGQSLPSSENLIALSKIFGVSLDLLTERKTSENEIKQKQKIIRQANLVLIAIILHASLLNVAVQPFAPEAYGLPLSFIWAYKLVPLFLSAVWMSFNLTFEKDIKQFQKNVFIELLYYLLQASVALFVLYSNLSLLAEPLIVVVALGYIFYINPKYMNRKLTRKWGEK